METWKPPQKPIWKKLISNWVFQVGVLFLIIFAVVMRDSFTNSSKRDAGNELPPVSKQIARTNTAEFAPANKPKAKKMKPIERLQKKTQTSNKVAAPSQTKAQTIQPLEKTVTVEIISISRPATEKLQQITKKLDETAMYADHKRITKFLKANHLEIKRFGKARKDFKFNQATELFVGEQDLDTGLNLGFYVQVIINENSTADAITAEVRFSSLLKLSGEPTNTISYDVVLKQEDTLIMIDPGAHDFEFSKEERDLFEASQKLEHLNHDSFTEGLSDIALVLQMK